MNGMNNVTLILSTYNGEKYLPAQLDSLLEQKNVCITLIVRDDGSTDSTLEILNSYRDKFYRVEIVKGENVGAERSFYLAAREAMNKFPESDYYAFCDQDDYWMETKLAAAIETLKSYDMNKPSLYFSDLMMTDKELHPIEKLIGGFCGGGISCDRRNAMSFIRAYGCTCVFNPCALKKFCSLGEDKYYIFHDQWLFAVCCYCGTAYFDPDSYILYRQTGHNASGKKEKGFRLFLQRLGKIKTLKNNKHMYESIAYEMLRNFSSELKAEDVKLFEAIAYYRSNFLKKIYLILTRRMKTKSFTKNLCIIGRIITNSL